MGTRHLQIVIDKEGNNKIQQYGQWDGYPSGQGISILQFLKKGNLNKYQENLSKVREVTAMEEEKINKIKDWNVKYPHLSRDCGYKIHKLIEEGKVDFVEKIDLKEAKQWCEGFYTIDFSKNEFTSEYHDKKHTFKLNELPSEKEYLELMELEEE